MATVACECPRNVGGKGHVHVPACPNRARGKGRQPKEYMDRPRVARSYSHARMAIEHLRNTLLRIAALDCDANRPLLSPLTLHIADCRMQCETVRRYLDGE